MTVEKIISLRLLLLNLSGKYLKICSTDFFASFYNIAFLFPFVCKIQGNKIIMTTYKKETPFKRPFKLNIIYRKPFSALLSYLQPLEL